MLFSMQMQTFSFKTLVMLAQFGVLHEEPPGGTRQRALPEAEAQSPASNALVCTEIVNRTHGHVLLTDT